MMESLVMEATDSCQFLPRGAQASQSAVLIVKQIQHHFHHYLQCHQYQKIISHKYSKVYSATSLVRPKLEELIPEKNSLEKIPKPLKRWMGRPQLLPEIVENVLRSLFWAAGSKQPSPCLQPPKVGGLLRHLLLLLKAPLTSLHF